MSYTGAFYPTEVLKERQYTSGYRQRGSHILMEHRNSFCIQYCTATNKNRAREMVHLKSFIDTTLTLG
jgi:hypothetical protein